MSFAVFFLVGIFKPMGIEIIANNNNNKKITLFTYGTRIEK